MSLRDGRTVLWGALALGLAARLILLGNTTTLLGAAVTDEHDYTQIATNILAGHGFAWGPDQPTSIRPPLFPGLIAAIWTVTGPGNLQAVRVVQIVMALLTTAMVFAIGRLAYGVVVGRYAAAVFWLYPSWILFNLMLLTETLFTFLLVAWVLTTIELVRSPRTSMAILSGLSLGLAALTRSILWPVPLLICPLLFFGLLRVPARQRLALAGLVFVGYAMVVVPWAVRNTRLQGVVTIVDTMGGLNLRMGNYEFTPEDRMWAAVGLQDEMSWSYSLTAAFPGEHFTEGQKDKWAQHEALVYIVNNPGTAVRRATIKFADLWGLEREFISGIYHGLFAPPTWFVVSASLLAALAYVLVALCGAAGLWLASPDRRIHLLLLVPILMITAVHTIVFAHSRYHMPLVPFLTLYGAALVVRWREIGWRAHRVATLGAALTVVLLVGIWIREILVVDADRLRTVLERIGLA